VLRLPPSGFVQSQNHIATGFALLQGVDAMLVNATVALEILRCIRESDESGHSEPYIWPALLAISPSANVSVTAPAVENARLVIKKDMRAGDVADIPTSVGAIDMQVDDVIILPGRIDVRFTVLSEPCTYRWGTERIPFRLNSASCEESIKQGGNYTISNDLPVASDDNQMRTA